MPRIPVAVLLVAAGVAGADDTAAKKFLKDLEGTYTATSMNRGGEAAPEDFLKTVSLQFKGDTLTIRFKKGAESEDKGAIIVIDPAQTPVAIDMTPKEGPDANKPVLGIVKVEKDTVTLCWGDRSDKPVRPKEFSSTKENKYLLIVLKKK